jgi:hypothetical protein
LPSTPKESEGQQHLTTALVHAPTENKTSDEERLGEVPRGRVLEVDAAFRRALDLEH